MIEKMILYSTDTLSLVADWLIGNEFSLIVCAMIITLFVVGWFKWLI